MSSLSPRGTSTDFPTTNNDWARKKYCYYFAVEWFHGGSSAYASKAIVKQNVCTGERVYWYRPNHFPSEPRFINDVRSDVEDDGTLLFTVLDGESGISSLRVLDTATMKEIDNYELPIPIAFTTHGQFYPEDPSSPTQ